LKGSYEKTENAEKRLRAYLSYIDQTVENVRRISQDLNPSILEDLGLTAALRWLVGEFLEYHQVESSVEIANRPSLSSEKEIIVYRIIQEAFTTSASMLVRVVFS